MDPQLQTLRELAALWGVSLGTMRRWCEGLTARSSGAKGRAARYAVADLVDHKWSRGEDGEEPLKPDQERARKDREQADKLAMENARARGELVPFDEIQEHWSRVTGEVRTKLLAVPRQAAPRVVGLPRMPEIEEVLDSHIRGALEAVAASVAGTPDRVQAAREAHSERMGGQESPAESGG